MMKKYINIVLAITLICFSGVSMTAEETLTKQIVVSKDYVPTEQKATKLNNLPEVAKVEATTTTLQYSDWAVPATVRPALYTLMPLGYSNTPIVSTKKGYATFGMGSYLNMVGSAGYKILNDELNTLNVWLQHNSTWGGINNTINRLDNQSQVPSVNLFSQKYLNDIFGVDYSRKIGSNIFSANAYYHFSRFNYFGSIPTPRYEEFQNVNEVNVALSYGSAPKQKGLRYHLGISYDHFGNSIGLKENNFVLNGDISTQIGDNTRLGVDLNGDMLYYASGTTQNESYGMVSLSPFYQYQNETMNLKLGLKVDISINEGTIFRFSPIANFDYKLLENKLIFYSEITGGKKLNKFSEITTINPYINPFNIIGSSYTPLDLIAGFKIGTFSGFSAKLWGGYAIVKNQQLPWSTQLPPTAIKSVILDHPQYSDFSGVDMSGFQVGLELGYKFKNLAELKTKFAYSPQGDGKGYIFSYDRPEYIIGADLTVNPIDRLKIIASYEYQGNRNMWSTSVDFLPVIGPIYNTYEHSLGNVNQLRLHASYEWTDMVTIFVQGNNLINAKWDKYLFMGEQKINFMGGVSVHF